MTQQNERERLARALYLIESSEHDKASRAVFWDSGEQAEATRAAWAKEADRLIGLLGGSPVVEQQPRAWEVRKDGHHGVCFSEQAERSYRNEGGWTITPLYAAPVSPLQEEAPTRAELVAALQTRIDNCRWCAHRGSECPSCKKDRALLYTRSVRGQWFALPDGVSSDVGPFSTQTEALEWLTEVRP